MTPDLMLAATRWPSNAELIRDLADKLGYLEPDKLTLDPTFGLGIFWKLWRPHPGMLITHHRPDDGLDFRSLPYPDRHFKQIAYDPPYCVDAETEILTSQGWRTWSTVQEGDLAYTLDHVSGLAEWAPVERKVVLRPEQREVLAMEGSGHSSLTTLDHRWPIIRRSGTRAFATSETLRSDDVVPTAAPYPAPIDPKYSDAFVELVAWFWTEGTLDRGRAGIPSNYGNIVQSHVVNDANCARIRAAFTAEFGADHGPFPRLGRIADGTPRWREAVDGHKAVFWFSSDLGALLTAEAPGRVPTFDFLRSLTTAQLELFIMISLMADGHTRAGRAALGQKSRAAAEAFQFACILSGRSTSIHRRSDDHMWTVTVKRRQRFKPSRNSPSRSSHRGLMWCVTTCNGTWLARRHGTVYFTGNCSEGGAATSTMRDYAERYGRDTVASAAFAVQLLVNDGLTEMWRLIDEGGVVLVKVMDYIWNADLWLGTHWTTTWAIELGFVVEEELRMYDISAGAQPFLSACINCGLPILRRKDHVTWTDRKRSLGGGPSSTCRLGDGMPGDVPHAPDPDAKTQDHAAYSCLSTMLVLRKPTGKRPRQYRFADFAAIDPTRLALTTTKETP
jgi:hypothetical protein